MSTYDTGYARAQAAYDAMEPPEGYQCDVETCYIAGPDPVADTRKHCADEARPETDMADIPETCPCSCHSYVYDEPHLLDPDEVPEPPNLDIDYTAYYESSTPRAQEQA